MYSTSFLFRVAKIISVAGIGLLALLITFNNITDYYSNYFFVEHVLKMDTTFPESKLHYRSIHSPFLFHTGYILIILLEAFVAYSCIRGCGLMIKNIKNDGVAFHASKKWALAGIITGIVIWFIGFQVIGGEWFVMWQSDDWNGLAAAERVLSFLTLVLILLHFKDE